VASTGTYGVGSARAGAPVTSRLGKYQLRVTARNATEVVAHAGGWLVDRAMAGWDVSVVLIEDCNAAPLRILGVHADLRDADDDSAAPLRSQSIAVSAAAIATDEELRSAVARTAKRGLAEVIVWGDADAALVPGLEPVVHVLSSAARAFKARALMAAGTCLDVTPTETFRYRTTAVLADYRDLTPSAATLLAQR
jgi:hypothetical protein